MNIEISVHPEIIKLAVHFLNEYANELSNNGCNDVSPEVLDKIKKIGVGAFSKMVEDWNGEPVENIEGYDWIIVNAISYHLQNKLP